MPTAGFPVSLLASTVVFPDIGSARRISPVASDPTYSLSPSVVTPSGCQPVGRSIRSLAPAEGAPDAVGASSPPAARGRASRAAVARWRQVFVIGTPVVGRDGSPS